MSVHTQMLRGLAALPLLFLACVAGVTAPAARPRCDRIVVAAPARAVAVAEVAMPDAPDRVVAIAVARPPREVPR